MYTTGLDILVLGDMVVGDKSDFRFWVKAKLNMKEAPKTYLYYCIAVVA